MINSAVGRFVHERIRDQLAKRAAGPTTLIRRASERQFGASRHLLFSRIGHDARYGAAWKVHVNNEELKAFELKTAERWAQLPVILTTMASAGLGVPKVVAVDDLSRIVFCTWIQGSSLESAPLLPGGELISEMAQYQASMHKLTLATTPLQFGHLREVVFPRLRRWAAVWYGGEARANLNALFSLAEDVLHSLSSELEPTVTNPDFVPANLVRGENGQLFLIDNQFLCVDYGWEFDLSLTLGRLQRAGPAVVEAYLDVYGRERSLDTYLRRKELWDVLVTFKNAGKALSFFRTDKTLIYEQLISTFKVFGNVHG